MSGTAEGFDDTAITVLVVDDDFRVAGLHAAMVQRVPGFAVAGVAHTAAQAVEMVRSQRPDLLLLDIYLPDRSGLDVARAVVGVPGAPDIILVTAARDAETVRTALRLGALHYLVKPFGLRELADRLEAYRPLHHRSRSLPASAEQADIDSLFSHRHPQRTPAPPVPDAVNPTLRTIVEIVRSQSEGVSASEVAQQIGISRATAQRYLVQLENRGEIERTLRYGSTGRPENRYRARRG